MVEKVSDSNEYYTSVDKIREKVVVYILQKRNNVKCRGSAMYHNTFIINMGRLRKIFPQV